MAVLHLFIHSRQYSKAPFDFTKSLVRFTVALLLSLGQCSGQPALSVNRPHVPASRCAADITIQQRQ